MSTSDPVIVKLSNVRLSFPQLFHPKAFSGGDGKTSKPAFSAVFLLDKKTNANEIKLMQAAIASVLKENNKAKPLGPDRVCLQDGSKKPDVDGYGDGVMFVSARNEKRPGVVNRDLSPLVEEDNKPYAGCYVNAVVRLWWQDNQYGKRVNASLRNVQFVKDGTPFGEKPVAAEEDFSALPEEGGESVL